MVVPASFKVESAKVLGPSSLLVVEILVLHKPLEVCMIIPDLKFMVCSF
jgi:hypothetical protein